MPALTIVVAATVLASTWALGIGRYGGPDEPAHVLRAAAVARGELVGEPAGAVGDGLPSGYRVVSVPAALASGDPACYRHDPTVTSECADSAAAKERVRAATSAGAYPPLYYALVGVPVRLIGGSAEMYWYRVVAAVLNAIVLAVVALRLRPFGHAAVVATTALTPAAWFLLGVVNPNGFELALVLLAWVGVARWCTDGGRAPVSTDAPPRWVSRHASLQRAGRVRWAGRVGSAENREAWWVSVPLAIAMACRPVAVLAALTVLVVVEVRARPTWTQRVRLWGPVALAGTAVAAWNVGVGLQVDDPRTAGTGSFAEATRAAILAVPTTMSEAINSLGWLEFAAPAGVLAIWSAIAVISMRAWRPSRQIVGPAVVWAVLLVATPVVFEVAVHRSLGPIWQGRYSLPTFVGIVALVLCERVSISRRSAKAIVALVVAVEVTTYWWVVRRYAVGTEGSSWLSDANASSALLPPSAWVAINAAVAVAVGVSLERWLRSLDVAEHVDDHVGAS